MVRSLPPLGALRSFDAAARHLSFAQAGHELGLTPGAVSHQVKLLEQWLGLPLFERMPNGVVLTDAGKEFGTMLKLILDDVVAASTRVKSMRARQRLNVHCQYSLATKWLAPRLPEFYAANPEIDVNLVCASQEPDWSNPDGDVFIHYSKGPLSGLEQEPVLSSPITVFVSPSLLAADSPTVDPQDLLDRRLMHLNWADKRWREPGWREWFKTADVAYRVIPPGPSFDLEHLAIEACVEQGGYGLFPTAFVERETSRNTLVRPFDVQIRSPHCYFLITPEANLKRPDVLAFWTWILTHAQL